MSARSMVRSRVARLTRRSGFLEGLRPSARPAALGAIVAVALLMAPGGVAISGSLHPWGRPITPVASATGPAGAAHVAGLGPAHPLASLPRLAPGLGAALAPKPPVTVPIPTRADDGPLRADLPALPHSVATGPTWRVAPAGPVDINLSGNQTLAVASDATVLNISLFGHSVLYVHGPTTRVTLTVLGNIRLYNNALLFVNASNLAIGESYDVEWTIQAADASQFATAYSNVTTNGYQWGAAYEGSANVTIVASLIGYPTGWLDSTLLSTARLEVFDSWYSSDVILFDSPYEPSLANFTAYQSAGFNVWLNFKTGAVANLSLPGLEGWRNWSFPAGAHVSGVGYSVDVVDSFVLVFAVMLWQGANLTLTNSPDVAISLNVAAGTLVLDGLNETHYARFGLYNASFSLTLRNTTVFTWNLYTFAGNAQVTDSEIGEIQVFGSTWATVHNSVLTAHGGYYGNQGSSDLSIFDSRVDGQVVAYSGVTVLENCTVNTTTPNRILAAGTGRLVSLDTGVAPVDSYEALASGSIAIAWSLRVNVTFGDTSLPGASVAFAWSSNGTRAANGTTDGTGGWSAFVTGETVDSAGVHPYAYAGTAAWGLDGAAWSVPAPSAPSTYAEALLPLVYGSAPSAGATGVADNLTTIVVQFAQPMNESATTAALAPGPTLVSSLDWDASGDNLSLVLGSALAPSTTYSVTLGVGAATRSGIPLEGAFSFSFTTAAPALVVPSVVSTSPSDAATNVSITSTISVQFSQAMDPIATAAAISIVTTSPATNVAGTDTVTGDRLVFVPTAALSYNTSYQVTVATTALSASGVPLAAPVAFSFLTQANPLSTHPSVPGPSNGTGGPALPWGALALAGALVAVALIAAVLFLRRRRPPAPAATAGSSVAPAPPPAWSEDEPTPASR